MLKKLKKLLKKILKKLKKVLKKLIWYLLISYYLHCNRSTKINKKFVLVDSKNGLDIGSNMLRLIEELSHNSQYQNLHVYVPYEKGKKKKLLEIIRVYDLKVTLIRKYKRRYMKVISNVGYLFTDTSFPYWYIKKEGQTIVNTWRDTPLLKTGRDILKKAYDIGNVQRNFVIADYLVYSSQYMKNTIFSAYFLNNIFNGKALYSGALHNSVFYKPANKDIVKAMGCEGRTNYAYVSSLPYSCLDIIKESLSYLDKHFQEKELMFVKFGLSIENNIDFSQYEHIKRFPVPYDVYDVLSQCDCLLTDKTNLIFDYAGCGKKIIIYNCEPEPLREPEVYIQPEKLPFPKVTNVEAALTELRSVKSYDDIEFINTYCKLDGADAVEKLCTHIFGGKPVIEEISCPANGKENVLLYAGALAQNGLTTAIHNLLTNINDESRNYYVSFKSQVVKKDPLRLKCIPHGIPFIPISSTSGISFGEKLASYLYYHKNKSGKWVMNKMDCFSKRYYERSFGNIKFDYVIQYAGYEKDMTNMFLQADCKRAIFVHNDMLAEMKTRNNQHRLTLERAYQQYDMVVPVTDDIVAPTIELSGRKDNIKVVNNCLDYKGIIAKSLLPITFEKSSACNISIEELENVLQSDSLKIISIGRFSPEKGHNMLIEAFERFLKEYPYSYLIIIGGHGELYKNTLKMASADEVNGRIIVIRSMKNPMPVLAKCDLFILSSLYEGLGLVILEADCLKIPVISTDIPGPRGFINENNGHLVEPTADGIYKGMHQFVNGDIQAMKVDYEKYNINSINHFEKLFS